MCIKCVIKKARLAGLGLEEKKEVLGKAPAELLEELNKVEASEAELKAKIDKEMHDEILKVVEAARTEIVGKLNEKYGKQMDDANALISKIQEEMLASVGIKMEDLDGSEDLGIHKETGEITRTTILDKKTGEPVKGAI